MSESTRQQTPAPGRPVGSWTDLIAHSEVGWGKGHQLMAWLKAPFSGSARANDVIADASRLQVPLNRALRIAVAGELSTTVAAALALTLAERRRDSVLVVDEDPVHSSLAWRLGSSQPIAPELVQKLEELPRDALATLEALLPVTRQNVRLLAAGPTLSRARTRELALKLSRLQAIEVRDVGPATEEAVRPPADPDLVVVAVPATPAGFRTALMEMPGWDVAAHRVVMVALNTSNATVTALNPAAARTFLSQSLPAVELFELPFDPHACAGTPMSTRQFTPNFGTAMVGLVGRLVELGTRPRPTRSWPSTPQPTAAPPVTPADPTP